MLHRLAVLSLALGLLEGETVDALLARMDRAAAAFRSLSAKVRRVAHTAVINENNIDVGSILVKRGKGSELRMLSEITEPDPKAVAYQGRKLEVFYPKIQTVQEFDVGKHRGLVEQFFLLGFGASRKELERDYSIRVLGVETVTGETATRVEFTPQSEQVLKHLKKAELWISETTSYPIQQKFYQSGGDYNLVTYTGVKINPELSDAALKLKLPKNVKREYPQK